MDAKMEKRRCFHGIGSLCFIQLFRAGKVVVSARRFHEESIRACTNATLKRELATKLEYAWINRALVKDYWTIGTAFVATDILLKV